MGLVDLILRRDADDELARRREALRDKVIAVTGGARGIGRVVAEELLDAGAKVALGDIDDETVAKTAADLGVEGFELDVTKRESFGAFLDSVEQAYGPIDVLINNAGIMPVGPLLAYDDVLIRRNLDINLYGVMTGTQLAAARMAESGGGQVVNVASVAGRIPAPGLSIYNGVKAGVIEFSEAADAELSQAGVRVSAVLPTFTNTGLITGLETNALVRTIEPEVVAEAVLGIIVDPAVRVTAPGSMAWVDSNPMMPQAVKRFARKITKMDRIFVDYDAEARADYTNRIRS